MFEWNWADLIIAFLGFLGAIGAAVLANKLSERISVNKMVKRIVKELKAEIIELEDDDKMNGIKKGESLSFRLIYLPYIESIKMTNQILFLSNKKWYNTLFELDYMMGEANRWATIASEYYINHIENIAQSQHNEMYMKLCDIVFQKCSKYRKKVKQLLCEIC